MECGLWRAPRISMRMWNRQTKKRERIKKEGRDTVQFTLPTYEVLHILSISLTDKTDLMSVFDKTIFNDVKGLDYPLFRGLID